MARACKHQVNSTECCNRCFDGSLYLCFVCNICFQTNATATDFCGDSLSFREVKIDQGGSASLGYYPLGSGATNAT
jgi:hypothetical protein